jgi:hypothetical protein
MEVRLGFVLFQIEARWNADGSPFSFNFDARHPVVRTTMNPGQSPMELRFTGLGHSRWNRDGSLWKFGDLAVQA